LIPSTAMPPRLLSLLSLIETALFEQGQTDGVSRAADYRRGIARMTFPQGRGSIVLHNFLLADGQLCIRIELRRTGVERAAESAIYPQAPGFDWKAAASRVAVEWMAMEPVETLPPVESAMA
jgi:hypothetical protein